MAETESHGILWKNTWNIGVKSVGVEGIEPCEEAGPLSWVGWEGPGAHQAVQEGLVVVKNLHIVLRLLQEGRIMAIKNIKHYQTKTTLMWFCILVGQYLL